MQVGDIAHGRYRHCGVELRDLGIAGAGQLREPATPQGSIVVVRVESLAAARGKELRQRHSLAGGFVPVHPCRGPAALRVEAFDERFVVGKVRPVQAGKMPSIRVGMEGLRKWICGGLPSIRGAVLPAAG